MTHKDLANDHEGSSPSHKSVLCEALTEWIRLPTDGRIVDGTVGHGGHSRLFGSMLGPEGMILGLDVDPKSIERAQFNLSRLACKVILVRENFARLPEAMKKNGLDQADLIFADLGFCSAQLEDVSKGLSFGSDMPLDMRLDDRLKTTAADLVNRLDVDALADLIYRYGEDRFPPNRSFYAQARQGQKITSTAQLAEIVRKALYRPGKRILQRIDPATRTFQALRIAVNSELENLEILLANAPDLLKQGVSCHY